ncbi:MAG: nucleotidyltransferase domain-containing protein [Thermodesulfovibrionales bacterium]
MIYKELDSLRKIFYMYPEIKLVYFFGSRAKRSHGPLSDYDFAVYFGDTKKKKMFTIKLDLIAQICRILKSDRVDVVILNLTKSPELKYSVLKEGILIFEKEPFKVIVEPKILNEYFDFNIFLSKYGHTKAYA